jgi:calcium/calmodulin-dependent protein kinase I
MIRKGESGEAELQPVLVDFGLAFELRSQECEFARCGTPGYTAPEILDLSPDAKKVSYGEKCDVFSLGVVAYIL